MQELEYLEFKLRAFIAARDYAQNNGLSETEMFEHAQRLFDFLWKRQEFHG